MIHGAPARATGLGPALKAWLSRTPSEQLVNPIGDPGVDQAAAVRRSRASIRISCGPRRQRERRVAFHRASAASALRRSLITPTAIARDAGQPELPRNFREPRQDVFRRHRHVYQLARVLCAADLDESGFAREI